MDPVSRNVLSSTNIQADDTYLSNCTLSYAEHNLKQHGIKTSFIIHTVVITEMLLEMVKISFCSFFPQMAM